METGAVPRKDFFREYWISLSMAYNDQKGEVPEERPRRRPTTEDGIRAVGGSSPVSTIARLGLFHTIRLMCLRN